MTAPRPRRADAERNRRLLLDAAQEAFNAVGADAALDDIAKAAGVGNATLYRHFPTRAELIEAVYDDRIGALCAAAREPGATLEGWLETVVAHIIASRGLGDAFMAAYQGPRDSEPPQVAAWHDSIRQVAAPLLDAAQRAGAVREDLDVDELMALTTAVARAGTPDQATRFLGLLLTGLHA